MRRSPRFNLATGYPEAILPVAKSVTHVAADADGSLYTYPCDRGGNCVGAYAYRHKSQLRAIREDIYQPISMIAKNRKLYVANANDSITIYKDLGSVESRKITNGISHMVSIAVDEHGSVYVANTEPSSVAVYREGESRPFHVITAGVASPIAIATDAFGTLYVLNAHGRVTEYADGTTTPIRTVARECKGIYRHPLMAVASDGSLFEACNFGYGVWIFNRGSIEPDYFIKNQYVNAIFAGPEATLIVFFGPSFANFDVFAFGSYRKPLWYFGNVAGSASFGFGRAW